MGRKLFLVAVLCSSLLGCGDSIPAEVQKNIDIVVKITCEIENIQKNKGNLTNLKDSAAFTIKTMNLGVEMIKAHSEISAYYIKEDFLKSSERIKKVTLQIAERTSACLKK
jgi:predicted dinucleotide-binding enzyme